MTHIMTEDERWVLLNALTVAKLAYESDTSRYEHMGEERLARQFRMQIADVQSMYEMIEQADSINLAPEADEPDAVLTHDGWTAPSFHR